MRISDWSADVCSSDLLINLKAAHALYEGSGEASFSALTRAQPQGPDLDTAIRDSLARLIAAVEAQPDSLVAALEAPEGRSEEHTSELQSLMRISSAVFCLKKKSSTAGTGYANEPHTTACGSRQRTTMTIQ